MSERRRPAAPAQGEVLDWLMAGDPAIRWQVIRDLLDRPQREWAAERLKVETQGWGARLVAERALNGRWGGGLYSPKWVSTHYTLLLLRSMGLPSVNQQAHRGAQLLLDGGVRPDGSIHFSKGRKNSETCETGMVLAICAYFGLQDARLHGLVEHLVRVQTPDGGWNCQWIRGSKHGSFHTTISVLEGLLEYQALFQESAGEAGEAQARGREFLLDRPPLPFAPHGRGRRRRDDAVLLPIALALRRASWPRLLPGGWRSPRRAASRRHGAAASAAPAGRALVAAESSPEPPLVRDGGRR